MNDLFIGGGGYSGVVFIGALEYIHENKLLDLKNFYGCSIGSLIGCLYISGYKPKDILSKFLELDLSDVVKYNFDNLVSESYIIDDSFLETLIEFLWVNVDENITIEDFSNKYDVNINVYATNLTKNEYTNINNKTYPEVKLKDALKASMSIPFIFKQVEINGDKFVDGCCKNLYGSPPEDIYICGYSIIINTISNSGSYLGSLMLNMVKKTKPRSTFTVLCENKADPKTYLNLDKLDKKFIIEMYKNGINFAKSTLKD